MSTSGALLRSAAAPWRHHNNTRGLVLLPHKVPAQSMMSTRFKYMSGASQQQRQSRARPLPKIKSSLPKYLMAAVVAGAAPPFRCTEYEEMLRFFLVRRVMDYLPWV